MADLSNTKKVVQRDFKPWLVYLFCFGVTLVFMFFFGLNSPIHTFNSHCDYQWFLTMGRGLVAGKVPYRDLFEQKGPIVCFVYAVPTYPNSPMKITHAIVFLQLVIPQNRALIVVRALFQWGI